MRLCIVFHSETGHTKAVADYVAKVLGADLIRVKDCARYNAVTRYLIGASCAHRGDKATIEPDTIDVTPYDLIVIGSPVWAWHPTPAINAAIAILKGCEKKFSIIYATSGGMPGETLNFMKQALEGRGVTVLSTFHFNRKEVRDEKILGEFIASIKTASSR